MDQGETEREGFGIFIVTSSQASEQFELGFSLGYTALIINHLVW